MLWSTLETTGVRGKTDLMKNFQKRMEIKQGKKVQKVVSLCSHKGQDLKRLQRKTRNMTTSKGLAELKDISVGLVWGGKQNMALRDFSWQDYNQRTCC